MSKISNIQRFASCKVHTYEDVVRDGLSMSPKDCYDLSSRGVSVSMPDATNFDDGVPNPPNTCAPEFMRGVDPADLWQAQKSTRNKISKAYANDKKIEKFIKSE